MNPLNDREKHTERMRWLQELSVQQPTGECVDWPWSKGSEGYPEKIRVGARRKRRVAHVLLELCGVQRPADAYMVLHSCDRPPCLAPWHLRWGTDAENTRDKLDRGRQPRGEAVNTARLTWPLVARIREAVAAGATMASQARAYGVSHPTISSIVNNRTWLTTESSTNPPGETQ
jgi:hypothetical protein